MNHFSAPIPYIEESEVLVEDLVDIESNDLIVYNDDFNTFDHVIKILMKVCKHQMEQAEQCAITIHYTGKCGVKKGTFVELKPMCEAILDAGIQATIE